jgi:hypothetical protein
MFLLYYILLYFLFGIPVLTMILWLWAIYKNKVDDRTWKSALGFMMKKFVASFIVLFFALVVIVIILCIAMNNTPLD